MEGGYMMYGLVLSYRYVDGHGTPYRNVEFSLRQIL